MAQFDKFTERARKVLQLAQEESVRFNHNYIGTEHLLLGLVREGDGVAARVLNNMDVQLPKVRSAVEFIIGRGDGEAIGDIGLTPRAKKVLELALDEGIRLNHDYISTEHLLLGLIREGEGIAAGVLESLGVGLENIRRSVMSVLATSAMTVSGRVEDSKPTPPARDIPRAPSLDMLHPRTFAVLAFAFEEAARVSQKRIDVPHLLLGIVREGGAAADLLAENGVRLRKLRSIVAAMPIEDSSINPTNSSFARGAENVFMFAWVLAPLRIGNGIMPEHVLHGIVTDDYRTNLLATIGVEVLNLEIPRLLEKPTFESSTPTADEPAE